MVCFVDIVQTVYLCELCNKQSLGRLACTNNEMNIAVFNSLKIRSIKSADILYKCLHKYGLSSFAELSDDVVQYIWFSDKMTSNIKIFKEIFDNYYCSPSYLRKDYDFNIYYIKTNEDFHCSSRTNISIIRHRETVSQSFMQALGWAIKPLFINMRRECIDYM